MVGEFQKLSYLANTVYIKLLKNKIRKELIGRFSKISNDKCHLTFGYLRNDAVPLRMAIKPIQPSLETFFSRDWV